MLCNQTIFAKGILFPMIKRGKPDYLLQTLAKQTLVSAVSRNVHCINRLSICTHACTNCDVTNLYACMFYPVTGISICFLF